MRITSYELKAAARTLGRHRGFTITAILSLAIAIGLNTTMYSVIDTLISPHIDLPHPEQLRRFFYFGDVRQKIDTRTKNAMFRSALEPLGTLTARWNGDWRALIESPIAYVHGSYGRVAPNYFTVLGAHTVKGRVFDESDMGATTPAVIISERLDRDLFPNGEESIGARIQIQGRPYVVIGVLSRESDRSDDSWVLPDAGTDLASLPLNMIRLRDAESPQLEPTMVGIGNRIAALAVEKPRAVRVVGFVSGRFDIRALFHFTGFQAALIYAVIAVLLVACANLANLQLARGIARSRELATRAALGASRRDIVTHLMLESALLAAAGVVLGIVLTFWGMHLLTAWIPESMGYYIVAPQTSWRLFAFATVAGVVCMLLVGLFPAIRVSRVDLNDVIKSGAGTGSTRRARRQYGLLIAAEIGFALVLVCGAALLVRAARQLQAEGEAWDQSMLTEVRLQVKQPPGVSRPVADLAAEVVSRMRAATDVADATVITSRADNELAVTVTDPGGALRTVPAPRWAATVVSPSYFRTMGFGIAHGRDFLEGESGESGSVIVDPHFARTLWPGADPLGRMVKFGAPETPGRWFTVVGVRKPVGIESTEQPGPGIGDAYRLPLSDDRITGAKTERGNPEIEVVVRASRNAHRTPIVVSAALNGDARLSPTFIGTFDEWSGAEAKRKNQNFVGFLFALFAAVALGLAALGVYGIVSHSVAERRREIGVRIALGSSARAILYVILREGNVFVLAGTAIGLWLIRDTAWLLRQFLQYAEADVYSVELYVPAAMFLFLVAVVSAFIPAHRATKIDPVEALRCE